MRGVQPDFDNPLVHKWNFVIQRELGFGTAIEAGYEGNHQAHQVILTNTDTNPNLGTFNTSISGASLQEIQPACSTCQSVGNGLSMTTSFGYGLSYAAEFDLKIEKAVQPWSAISDVLCLEPHASEQRYSAERFEQPLADFEHGLGDCLFQRSLGYPA